MRHLWLGCYLGAGRSIARKELRPKDLTSSATDTLVRAEGLDDFRYVILIQESYLTMQDKRLSRRAFVSGTTAAAATALITRGSAAERRKPNGFPGFDNIDLAIASICTDGFGNQHHAPAMKFIPELGFKNIELNLWYADQITPRYVSDLKQRCLKAGLQPISVQATSFGAEGGRSGLLRDVAHKLLMIQHARTLECRIVKFTGSRRGTAGGVEAIIEVCKELVPVAEELGVLVTLENHVGNNLETVEDFDKIFSAIDSPNVGLCLDTGHFEGSGIALADVVNRFHSRTLHVDLKDCRRFGQGHDTVPFGVGVTDFETFLAHLFGAGYRGYLVVEQAWREPQGNWKADLRSAYQRFKKWIT